MKKILFYESRPEWGGAQKCELELLLALEEEALETFFVTSTNGPMNDRVKAAGKSITVIPINDNVNQIRNEQVKSGILFLLFQFVYILPHLYKVLLFMMRNRIELVYTSQFRSQLIIGWLAKLLGRKVIWHIHGEEKLNNLLGGIGIFFADKIIVVSHAIADKYRELYPKQEAKFVVVHNGLDIPAPVETKKNPPFTISMIGTLVEGKRQDLAITACATLNQMGYQVQLKILGEKPPWHTDDYKNSLLDLTHRLDCTQSVLFLGWIEKPWSHLHQSDVFILPSDTEGLPLSIIEAMALGLPVISTKVGGVPELIEDGKTGFMIHPGKVDELVDKLKLLYDQPYLRKQIGQQARKRYEHHFTKESFVKGVAGVINTIQ
jgi:L-malate glycosyltransferase